MDNTKKTVNNLKERVQSFLWYSPYREILSGTAGPKTKPKNRKLSDEKDSYDEKVMTLSQIVTRIESFIVKS